MAILFYIFISLTTYSAHLTAVTLLMGNENVVGNYLFSALVAAITLRSQGYLINCFQVIEKKSNADFLIRFIRNFVIPTFPIYLICIPILGKGIFEIEIIIACLINIFLMHFIYEKCKTFFWQCRAGDFLLVDLDENISLSIIHRNWRNIFLLTLLLPLCLSVTRFFYK
jgi:hypothetical protein